MVRKPDILKCHALTGTETKLACIKQALFFTVPLGYFQNNLLVVDKKLIRRKF
jgi:hypothetical protein